jgi:hypothetical protein
MTTDVIVEPDDRGRISLSRFPGPTAERYVGRRLLDGSIILQPAVVLTEQALASLMKVHSARTAGRPQGRALREVLDRFGSARPTEDEVDAALSGVAQRRASGARFLSDLTPAEVQAMRDDQGGEAPSA